MSSIKSCYDRAYEADIFSNWQITGCRVVVGLYRSTHENGAIFRVSVRGPVSFWLAGGTGPKGTGISAAFIINRTADECEAIRPHHALDCGIILDGEVANLV